MDKVVEVRMFMYACLCLGLAALAVLVLRVPNVTVEGFENNNYNDNMNYAAVVMKRTAEGEYYGVFPAIYYRSSMLKNTGMGTGGMLGPGGGNGGMGAGGFTGMIPWMMNGFSSSASASAIDSDDPRLLIPDSTLTSPSPAPSPAPSPSPSPTPTPTPTPSPSPSPTPTPSPSPSPLPTSTTPTPTPTEVDTKTVKPVGTGKKPVYSMKNNKLYMDGNEIVIKGVSWAGLNSGYNLDGVNPVSAPVNEWIKIMRASKINCVRIPMSMNIILDLDTLKCKSWGLTDMTVGQHLDGVIKELEKVGILVMINFHKFAGDDFAPNEEAIGELWYSDNPKFKVNYTEDLVTKGMVGIATRYKNSPNVFAMDLKNEIHGKGKWGGGDPKFDWPSAAERMGNAVLAADPNVLILVSGVESIVWGDDLSGAITRPVKLSVPDRVVYTPHFYPVSPEWLAGKKWTWRQYMDAIFGSVVKAGLPIIVGEVGFDTINSNSGSIPPDANQKWLKELPAYMNEMKIQNCIYWCLNAYPPYGYVKFLDNGKGIVMATENENIFKTIVPAGTNIQF